MQEAKEADSEYAFYIDSDLGEYAGKWIAIVDGAVVASGERANEVYMEAERTNPGKDIALAKVPVEDTLIL